MGHPLHYTFSPYIESLCVKESQRLSVLNLVAAAEWGSDLSDVCPLSLLARIGYLDPGGQAGGG